MAAQAQETAALQFYMMGNLAIIRSDMGLIESLNRKEQALLCYLKVNGRSCSRRELEAMLWPDSAKSQVSLRVAINHLRQAGVEQFLDISDEAMAFNQQNHWSDVQALQYQLNQGAENPQVDLQALMHIVDQCQDDFLPGLKIPASPMFEEWKRRQQSKIEQLLIQALERLVLLCSERGADNHAKKYAERLVGIAPWHRNAQQYLAGVKNWDGNGEKNSANFSANPSRINEPLEQTESILDQQVNAILESDCHPLSFADGRLLLSMHWGKVLSDDDDDDDDEVKWLCQQMGGHPLAIILLGRLLRERPYLTIQTLNQQLTTLQSNETCAGLERGVCLALAASLSVLNPSVREVLQKIVTLKGVNFTVTHLAELMQQELYAIQDYLDHLVRLALLQKVDETHYQLPNKLLLLIQAFFYE